MKIVIFTAYSPTLTGFRRPLIEALLAAGHEIVAAAPGLDGNSAERTTLETLGVRCRELTLARTGTNPLRDLSTYRHMRQILGEERPDVVFAYLIKAVIYGMLAAASCGVPRRFALITGLGYAFIGERRGFQALVHPIARTLYGRALRKADLVFFQNPDDERLFRDTGLLGVTPSRVVDGSGVDLDQYRPVPMPDGPPIFLLVARVLKSKGVAEYAAAAARLKAERPDARFLLVGGHDSNPDAIDEKDLARWTQAGLDYVGPQSDVRPWLAQSHVFVLPSWREGTPRASLEAMATGRAIVTTDAPGCRETVIEGENGLLVPVGDVDALTEAMRTLANDPARCRAMGERSLQIARARYDVEKVNAAMLEAMGLA